MPKGRNNALEILDALKEGYPVALLVDQKLNEGKPVPFLGHDAMSPRMAASLDQFGITLAHWPQLGSGTTLGAALATNVIRRILLRQLHCSGRFYVDLARLIRDEAPKSATTRGEHPWHADS